MITFDDGYLDNWFRAWPVLEEYNLHAHIFLITGLIGEGKYVTGMSRNILTAIVNS
ncbi:hypothetical protein ECZC10_46460 [Escherichia coli]|nr:hypothetical protein ECZC10_46460 [Escherichia coli]